MKYVVIFLFTEDLSKVLLIKKTHGPYTGCWNGVGGKIENGEDSRDAAVRETEEEVGVDISLDCKELVYMKFNNNVELTVFYAMVDPADVSQMEEEPIQWYPANQIAGRLTPIALAGDGNVPYFVSASIYELYAYKQKMALISKHKY